MAKNSENDAIKVVFVGVFAVFSAFVLFGDHNRYENAGVEVNATEDANNIEVKVVKEEKTVLTPIGEALLLPIAVISNLIAGLYLFLLYPAILSKPIPSEYISTLYPDRLSRDNLIFYLLAIMLSVSFVFCSWINPYPDDWHMPVIFSSWKLMFFCLSSYHLILSIFCNFLSVKIFGGYDDDFFFPRVYVCGFFLVAAIGLNAYDYLYLRDHDATPAVASEWERERPTVQSPAPIRADGSRVALVVGNAAYHHEPLDNPINDAQDMASMLETCGFSVVLETDTTYRALGTALDRFGRRIPRGGVALFYYAGHGVQIDGRNYLVPIGADPGGPSDIKFECLDVGRVLGKFEDGPADLNILVLDACRNDPFERSWTRSLNKGLAGMSAPTGSVILYSTGEGRTAYDGIGRNSPFTASLLGSLAVPNLDMLEVFRRTSREVRMATGNEQVPWMSLSYDGEFKFLRQAAPTLQEPRTRDMGPRAEVDRVRVSQATRNGENGFLVQCDLRFRGFVGESVEVAVYLEDIELSAVVHPAQGKYRSRVTGGAHVGRMLSIPEDSFLIDQFELFLPFSGLRFTEHGTRDIAFDLKIWHQSKVIAEASRVTSRVSVSAGKSAPKPGNAIQKNMAQDQKPGISAKTPETKGEFVVSRQRYSYNGDWSLAVASEFGADYRVADWNDLHSMYRAGEDLKIMLDAIGIKKGDGAAVLRNGRQQHSFRRTYYFTRHEQTKPNHFLAHDEIGGHLLSLGSWNTDRRILATRKAL